MNGNILVVVAPDRLIRNIILNIEASKSVDLFILLILEAWCGGFRCSKIMKGWVSRCRVLRKQERLFSNFYEHTAGSRYKYSWLEARESCQKEGILTERFTFVELQNVNCPVPCTSITPIG